MSSLALVSAVHFNSLLLSSLLSLITAIPWHLMIINYFLATSVPFSHFNLTNTRLWAHLFPTTCPFPKYLGASGVKHMATLTAHLAFMVTSHMCVCSHLLYSLGNCFLLSPNDDFIPLPLSLPPSSTTSFS